MGQSWEHRREGRRESIPRKVVDELKGRINQCIINNVRYQLGRATTVRESKRVGYGT